ncbi:solute carrier organic anion transporter family member 2A1-like [Engraulis encrasicolus]|uniref:solute carrier organic anion transporter family member 2A1-like n=1 Tax=Engraulis encrasicolus TaxID=184585 RepID=UPI002FD6E7C5
MAPLKSKPGMLCKNPATVKTKVSLLSNIKVFVMCHSLLQLSQLLHTSYFKSSISTIERRYGYTSVSTGSLTSLHEVGNLLLVVFVSYLGNRVHRPRVIGLGGLLMAGSAALLALPHFLSEPYQFNSALTEDEGDMCVLNGTSSSPLHCRAGSHHALQQRVPWGVMAAAQLLFGLGSAPIQPLGISYIDDFSEPSNSALYIAILFSVSIFGPACGYLLGSVMLRIYVDVDRLDPDANVELVPSDPRWVGAWWMGLLVSSTCLLLTSTPYFLFPRHGATFTEVAKTETDALKGDTITQDTPFINIIKMFPRFFLRLLLNPVFMLLVLSQCMFSCVISGLATFLAKYLELQFGTSAAKGSFLMGVMNLPAAAMGMLLGGVVMKRARPSARAIPWASMAALCVSILLSVPLFFMGCPLQDVSGINMHPWTEGSSADCTANCSCLDTAFNPVCGENHLEYISPCHAGCTNYSLHTGKPVRIQAYTQCRCVVGQSGLGQALPGSCGNRCHLPLGTATLFIFLAYTQCRCVVGQSGLGQALPGSCGNRCSGLLLPAMVLIAVAGFISSLTNSPLYMLVLRCVSQEQKVFAIGVQFLLLRMLAWLPGPTLFGVVMDSACVWWKRMCGSQLGSCGYYDNELLRSRYFGVQMGLKILGIILLALAGWKVQRGQGYNLDRKGPVAV